MYEYKEDIRNTRLHALGSSDGKILKSIAAKGEIPRSAYKRLAVCNGLIPQTEIPKTAAIKAGDVIENLIYEHLQATNPKYESNPLVISEKYSKPNCRLLSHPDVRLIDEDKKSVIYIEIKASKFTTEQVRREYEAQLYIHLMLAREEAEKKGKGWTAKVYLAHYNTDGVDLNEEIIFDPSRLTVKSVKFPSNFIDINKAMTIVEGFLDTFDYYSEDDEVDANYLPANVKSQFSEVAQFLREIKERESKVNDFKKRLFEFLTDRNIKKVSCDEFSFTVVSPSQQTSIDYKNLFTQEIEAKKPRVAKRLKDKYKKISERRGYVLIKTNDTNE